MAKYSYELKLKIVREYLQGGIGYTALAKKYHIASDTEITKWVSVYRSQGEDALRRSRQRKAYSFEFKLHAVESYLSTETSYRELAQALGMSEPSILANWVSRYRAVGLDGLKPQQKGRRPTVPRPSIPKEPENEQQAYIEQLEEEVRYLRIKVSYLKALRRLRLAEKAQRQKQGLPTVSEDPTS